ncbi:50S ribosomal protein L19 [Patescibacteria group bacterium]|nr:50S ribosomal protein L19 [Patescibacteria group bacterium]
MNTVAAGYLLNKYGKKNPPMLKAGDTVRVHQRIKEGDKERVQVFEGLVIATKHGISLDGTFTVRKIAVGGIGVERTFPVHSPNVLKVERLKTADVNRAKLYYMRERQGKSARFKHETAAYEVWQENANQPEIEATEELATEAIEGEGMKEEIPTDEVTVEMAEAVMDQAEEKGEPEPLVEEPETTEATEEEK